ncbi:MAG TPA: DUF1648 domain-containing protein [Terracidiphilus sp.]|nr:DUF1648 domain-containing protein [Terracidiphilus sp.]
MRKILELVALIALSANVWITYRALSGPQPLPSRIPTHFDAAGNPNGWGSPSVLILLPVISIALYLGFTIVSRFPMAFHYPVRVTEANLQRVQSLTLDMLAWMKSELSWMFCALQYWMIAAARSGEGKLPALLVPGFLVLILGTIGVYLVVVISQAARGDLR